MTTPRWFSQPFPPAGSISAEGIKKTLGRPPIPWPAILVRESAQNSWDARLGDRPVQFTLNLAIVAPQHANSWRGLLLEGAPHSDKFPLRQTLRSRDGQSAMIRTLTISDRGTKGLGGPTRADTARGDEPRDWVSFVLNVGDAPDTKHGGGTYGYGKGILYQTSRVGTIIVHTKTPAAGRLESRLIGICLGESMELPDAEGSRKPYTGRHWWGHAEETYARPLVGDEATAAAASLGLPEFRNGESGTDVVVVDPDFGEDNDSDTAQYLADSIAWNLWPIMLERRGADRLAPAVWHAGQSVTVPVPEKTLGLKTFVAAYSRLKDEGSSGVQTLSCGNPKKPLGRLALERQLIPAYDPPAAARDMGVNDAPHHVCLMRSPELVVKYHAGPPSISANLAYGGVFRAFDDLDRTYASAEPPTHDDWVFAQLDGNERTFVRTTFVRLKEQLTAFAKPAEVRAEGSQAPLGAASNFLGSLVAAAGGSGAASMQATAHSAASYGKLPGDSLSGKQDVDLSDSSDMNASRDREADNKSFATTPNGRATARLYGEPLFKEHEGGMILAQTVVVRGTGTVKVRGVAGVLVADGTREQEPPDGAGQPAVIGWRVGDRLVNGDTIELAGVSSDYELSLLVAPVADTVTQIDIVMIRDEGV